MDYAIEVINLGKNYGDLKAINDMNFGVKEGEIYCLLGPNGAGKSTTLGIISTLIHPSRGRALVYGYDTMIHKTKVRQCLSMVTQELSLDILLSVEENLNFAVWVLGLRGKQKKRVVNQTLEQFGLSEKRKDKVLHLSGGLMRRLQIARALMIPKPVILLDEPTLGIDIAMKVEIWDHIKEIVRENPISVVLATNDMAEAERLGDRIGFIKNGTLVAEGTLKEIKKLSEKNFLEIHVKAIPPSLTTILTDYNINIDNDEQLITVAYDESCKIPCIISQISEICEIYEINTRSPRLEDVFIEITKSQPNNHKTS